MSESMQVRDHLDNFNRIILDLNGVGVKVEEEDQAMILLYFYLALMRIL